MCIANCSYAKEHKVLPKVTSGRLSRRQMYTFSKPSKVALHAVQANASLQSGEITWSSPRITPKLEGETPQTSRALGVTPRSYAQNAARMNTSFNRNRAGRTKDWHPTASKYCLHLTMEGELRASQRHPKPKLHTTALAKRPCEQVFHSTHRVQYSPPVNKETPALKDSSLYSYPKGDGEHVARPVPMDLK